MIELSVIIPTHNRAKLLAKHLLLLKEQSLPAESFEVIVSADGCTDDTAAVVQKLDVPYRITLLERNPGTGAAGARNRGATAARGDLLLFLDDDMEPRRELLRAHLQAHRAMPGVVLGYYPMQPPEDGESVFTRFTRLWWAERLEERSKPEYRFSFYDLCTGNVSITKNVFRNAGGFEESINSLGAGEDYELGYRLIRQRVPFRFARAAESVHHSRITLAINLRRVREDGYGQATMARKHPELFWEFNVARLSRLSESTVLRPVWLALWKFPILSDAPIAVIRGLARFFLAMRVDFLFWKLHRLLKAHAYWRGVVDALGSLSVWERLAQDAPYEPPGCREVDLDLSRDLERLDEFMQTNWPVDSVRVFASGESVGRIAPWAAAEALRADHVRTLLVSKFSAAVLRELVARHSRLGVLLDRCSPGRKGRGPEVSDPECQTIEGGLHLSQ
jgi:glycosyltransferase involved in cell wall biosynthesis